MGTCTKDPVIKDIYFFDAFKDIKNEFKYIKENSTINKDVYLIKTKSMPQFIKLIKETDSLNNNDNEKELIIKLRDYKKEETIEFITDSEEGNKLANSNEEDNEFIIVGDKFIEKMNLNQDIDITNKKVNLFTDKELKLKIRFKSSHQEIFITSDNNNGFYKFIK